jgi:medium-chain acyl-[acyl-carrier-protein] hydrolase
MGAILPALKADAALYRNYIYTEEPALGCPIRAYGGQDDPNIRLEHLEAWREQTTGSFAVRQFPGGHFYLFPAQTLPNGRGSETFLGALAEDLA